MVALTGKLKWQSTGKSQRLGGFDSLAAMASPSKRLPDALRGALSDDRRIYGMGFKIKATGTENAINPTRTQKALDEKDVRIERLERIKFDAEYLYWQLHNVRQIKPQWMNDNICEAMRNLGEALGK